MILRWPVSECFGSREKGAKGLIWVWGNARNMGVRNLETTVPALLLSSGTLSLSLSHPEPKSQGLFYRDIICPAYPPELS